VIETISRSLSDLQSLNGRLGKIMTYSALLSNWIMSHFKEFDRNRQYLPPPYVDEWLREDYLARFIAEVTDQLNLSNFEDIEPLIALGRKRCVINDCIEAQTR
jgi:hypothetical protein